MRTLYVLTLGLFIVGSAEAEWPARCLLYQGSEDCFEANPASCPAGTTCYGQSGVPGGYRCPSTPASPYNDVWRENGQDAPQTFDKFSPDLDPHQPGELNTMSGTLNPLTLNCAKGGDCSCKFAPPPAGSGYGAQGSYICFKATASWGASRIKYWADWSTPCP